MNSALYVRRFCLNLIRDLIGNQCSDLSRGLDSESKLDLATTRARQLCTRCNKVNKVNYIFPGSTAFFDRNIGLFIIVSHTATDVWHG